MAQGTFQTRSHMPQHPEPACASATLRVLSTTDVHANLRAYDYYTGKADQPYGLTRLATLVRKMRREAPNSILLDNGDFLQGTPLSDLTAKPGSDWTGKHPVIAAMNLLGYDAGGLGNHEFNFGVPWLLNVLAQATFPFTCGNVLTSPGGPGQSPETLLPPYLVLPTTVTDETGEQHMIRIGVLSLLPPQITTWDQFHLAGQIWSDSIDLTARRLVPQMRKDGSDLVLVLAHSGMDKGPYHPMMENAVLALTQVPDIDAIMGGHAHQVFPPKDQGHTNKRADQAGHINGVPVAMAGFRGSHLGMIDLNLRKDAAGWAVTQATTAALPVAGDTRTNTPPVPEAADLMEQLEPVHRATVTLTQKPLGHSDRTLHSYLSLVGECSTVHLVNRAQAQAARQLAQNLLGQDEPLLSVSAPFRSGGHGGADHYCDIPAGPLFMRHAADLYPFPNVLCVARITGAELRDWLERSATVFNTIRTGVSGQILINPDIPNHVFDVIDGVTYRIDVTQAPVFDARGDRITSTAQGRIRDLRYNGQPIDDDRSFAIATNNFRAFGGGPHAMIPTERLLYTGHQPIVELVCDYIQSKPAALVPACDVWQFEPVPDTEVSFFTGPGVLHHPQDLAARGLAHVGSAPDGFEQFTLPL